MNKRRWWGWPFVLVSALLAGCGQTIVGQWRSIEPSEGSPEVPRLRQVEFNSDGQFQGSMVRNGRIIRLTGTYEFDGSQLFLTPDAGTVGGTHVYRVRRIGEVVLLTSNGVITRLCRELPSTPPESSASSETAQLAAASAPAVDAPSQAAPVGPAKPARPPDIPPAIRP
jgi:hypothetical protein